MGEAQAAALTVKDILANVKTVASNTSSKQVDLKAVIDVLKVAIVDLAKLVEKGGEEDSKKTENLKKQIKQQDDKIKTLDERLKQQDDEIDNQIQRNLKGKIVITSSDKEPSPIKNKEGIAAEGIKLEKHVVNLIKDKYNVEIKEDDIKSCYHLQKGGVVVSFWKKSQGSAFQKLATAIKSNTGARSNIFFNFMLTKKRSKLLFEIRKLKRAGTVSKFYSDEDGTISIRIAKDNRSEKVTNIRNKESSHQAILTVQELLMKAQ